MVKLILIYCVVICIIDPNFVIVNAKFIGLISNISLNFSGLVNPIVRGSCQQCLCHLLANENTFSSFNCFENSSICQMHTRVTGRQRVQITQTSSSKFYFLSLPEIDNTTLETSGLDNVCFSRVHIIQMSVFLQGITGFASTDQYTWSFDYDFNDLTNMRKFTDVNEPTLTEMTIKGHGASVYLNPARYQYLSSNSISFLNLANTSWTFQAWIYIESFSWFHDYSIIGHCQQTSHSLCLHLNIRNYRLYFGLYSDDLEGTTTLSLNRWYHVTYSFDCASLNQSLYLDGFHEATRKAVRCYQATQAYLTVGHLMGNLWSDRYFSGYIDELKYFNWGKSANEILDDGSLTAYFSFNSRSTVDQSSLKVVGDLFGTSDFVPGKIGEGLKLDYGMLSYFRINRLISLGTTARSYSFSIWIKPTAIRGAVVVHFSNYPTGIGWCLPMLTVNDSMSLTVHSWQSSLVSITGPTITIDQWHHVAVTYSSQNGLRLYLNGSSVKSSSPFSYKAPQSYIYLFLGSFGSSNSSNCSGTSGLSSQFIGILDEFRLYSRELSSVDIYNLANDYQG